MILEGTTSSGAVVPVQVTTDGKVVAEGRTGPEGPQGPEGPEGPQGPEGPAGAPGNLWSGSNPGPISYTGGTVGIGTASPTRPLTVATENGGGTNILGVFDTRSGDPQVVGNSVIAFSDPTSTAGQFATRLGSVGNSLAFYTNGSSERARIDSEGRLLVGTASSTDDVTAVLQGYTGNPVLPGILKLQRGISNPPINYGFGSAQFGTPNGQGAYIQGATDGAWADGTSHAGRLEFHTTPSGSTTPVERMRIDSQGDVIFQGAPIIRSPDGTHWAIEVDNNGTLSAFPTI